ncbi:MAG: AAA family ATPase [Legionella sp.]|nr:AAA family ATPase [Legionella sp.]
MLISKIIFIGLPGAGKSSVSAQLAEKHTLFSCSSDAIIKKVLNDYTNNTLSPESIYFKKLTELKATFINNGFDAEKVESAFQRQGYEKHSSAFMTLLNEPCWREVEATITASLINEHPDYMFDLGASQILNDLVKEAIRDNDFHLVYLDADEIAIEHHLLTPQIDGKPRWQSISNYQKAGDGWLSLAQEHRQTRGPQYADIADEAILVHENTSIDELVEAVEQLVNSKTPRPY